MFKIIRIGSHSKRYNYAYVEGHKYSDNRGRVLEHRAIMELHIGRYLTPDEDIHHINGNGKDNRIENLQILSRSNHTKHHHSKGVTMVKLVCPNCKLDFERPRNQTHIVKGGDNTFCSRSCSTKYYKNNKSGV